MLQSVIEAVRTIAQQEIMPRYLKVAYQRKTDGSVFTEADIAAQTALIAALKAICDCPVLGEEMSAEQHEALWCAGSESLWCIDPIDGTSNFVNGLPYFAVSVALMRGGRSVLGVIYNPVANEMFWAEQGKGAWLNGVRLPLKEQAPDFNRAMAAIDFKRLKPGLAQKLVASPPFASQRNFGASTLEWCYVAAGRFSLYLHGGQKLWDYAAGSLILAEAGGSMCTLSEDDFWAGDLWTRPVIAALDSKLFDLWKSWVRSHQ
ncbi:MAG: inositol monophosphatase family protein [Sulfuricella sp.]|nr:inositol monophosphatase family protein [Sulfuricella sp.]